MVDPLRFLEEQKIDPGLIKALRAFRDRYEVESKAQNRLASPMIPFYGKDILEMAIAGLLEGENLLLYC